ncbi:MAG: tRNA pseudouridine(54/55) synthase Pus10 [Candidatus Nitrosopumilus sp. bin_6a]
MNKINKKYTLCDYCLGRLFSKQLHLSSNRLLGKKLNNSQNSAERCYICKNLFDNLDHFLKLILDASSNYTFSTFGIGVIIKPSIIDRDDSIRSEFKLKGIDSIKADVAKELGKLFSRKTKKRTTLLDPEIMFTLNLKDELCQLRSKPITISGRYVKPKRGFPQKQKPCDNCSGKGCRVCDFHGIAEFDSVEGVISKFIFKKFGGMTAKFTWIGGEDKSSLVLGSGRPFFVKIQNPVKRKSKLPDITINSINLHNLKLINESPKRSIKFTSTIRVKISTGDKINSKYLTKLKELETNPVVVYEKSGKRSEKKIFDVKYKKDSMNSFTLTIKAEGGLPIKRFVIGDDVVPNVAKILETSCISKEFDFLEIMVNDNN